MEAGTGLGAEPGADPSYLDRLAPRYLPAGLQGPNTKQKAAASLFVLFLCSGATRGGSAPAARPVPAAHSWTG